MSDGFSPEDRKSAWWATDTRRAVSGHLWDVIAEKQGTKERDDLSEVEAVQMGLKMQPIIGKLFEEQTEITVKDLDIAGTCNGQPWLRAHGDFTTGDGGLLEVKNFHAASINKYGDMDDSNPIIPEADRLQCLHEACVFNVDHVWFAVLFGGQRFRYWKLTFTKEEKLEFIERAAHWWAASCAGTMPPPENSDQAKQFWPRDNGDVVIATQQVETIALSLKNIKAQLSQLEEAEEKAKFFLQEFMRDKSQIVSPSGDILVTWKQSKGTKKFDAKKLQAEMPEVYDRFCFEQPGSRRFLVK
jgi:predicted phage-related endonuclease